MKTSKKERKSIQFIRITVIALLLALLFPSGHGNRSVITGIALAIIGGSFLYLPISRMMHRSFQSILKDFKLPKRRSHWKQKDAIFEMDTLLIRQIGYQITDKIKAAYPEASWEYTRPPKVESLLNCNVFRIRTFHTGDYNFAEVSLDRYGHLKLFMMTIKDFTPLPGQKDPDHPEDIDTGASKESPVHIDPEAWYSLIGKPLLTEVIGDLQARGHQKLFINETGEIFILTGNTPDVKDTLEHFPPKDYWSALTDIFIRDELQAKEIDNTLELSWM